MWKLCAASDRDLAKRLATALETAMETAKVTAGDVGGGGGDTAIAATATAMAVMIAGSFRRYISSHRGKESEPPNQKRIPLHLHGILFIRIMDGG